MGEREALDVRTPCCDAQAEVTVRLSVRIPASLWRRVTKAALRRAGVAIKAADWHRAIWSCPTCHRVWSPGELPRG